MRKLVLKDVVEQPFDKEITMNHKFNQPFHERAGIKGWIILAETGDRDGMK